MVDNWNPDEKPNEIWKVNNDAIHEVLLIYDDRVESFKHSSTGTGEDGNIDPKVGHEAFEGKLIASSTLIQNGEKFHFYPYVVLDRRQDPDLLWLSYENRDEAYRKDWVEKDEKEMEPHKDEQFLRDHGYQRVAVSRKKRDWDWTPSGDEKPEDFNGPWDR